MFCKVLLFGGLSAFSLFAFILLVSEYVIALGKFATFDGQTGPIGDKIGGSVGPIIGILLRD